MLSVRTAPAVLRVAARAPASAVAPIGVPSTRLPKPFGSRSAASHLPAPSASVVVRAAGGDAAPSYEPPETARQALDIGLDLCGQKKWEEALKIFEKALTLPGTGTKRFKDRPRLISDSEKMTALYNIACCQAQLGDARAGLVALASCMEIGYDEFAQIRADPDLSPLREDPRFEGLMQRFEPQGGAGGLGGLLGGFNLGGLFGGGGGNGRK